LFVVAVIVVLLLSLACKSCSPVNSAHFVMSMVYLMKYTASNMLVKLKQSRYSHIQESKNKENKIRLHNNEQEGNALK